MARPFWSGQIQISLVSFGVKLFPATEAKSEIHFHEISRKSGERVGHHKVSGSDDAPVEKHDIVKGYEHSKGEYIKLDPEEIGICASPRGIRWSCSSSSIWTIWMPLSMKSPIS